MVEYVVYFTQSTVIAINNMQNKLNKVLISLSGAALVGAGMLGIKVQKASQDNRALRSDLAKSLEMSGQVQSMIEQQAQKEAERLQRLEAVDKSVPASKTTTTVKTTVIPGKVVPQTTTKTSTSKTTKTS